jgi:hypothetical protein
MLKRTEKYSFILPKIQNIINTCQTFSEVTRLYHFLHQVRTAEDFMRVFATPTHKQVSKSEYFADIQKKYA